MSFLTVLTFIHLACSYVKCVRKENSQEGVPWHDNCFETIWTFCKHFDEWRNKKRSDHMSISDFDDYQIYVIDDQELCIYEKIIIKVILDDLKKINWKRNTKNVTTEYKTFYTLFKDTVKLYQENYCKDELTKYLSEPYTDIKGEKVNKEKFLTTFLRSKNTVFYKIETELNKLATLREACNANDGWDFGSLSRKVYFFIPKVVQ